MLIASMPAGAAPGPGGKSLQVTAFAGRLTRRGGDAHFKYIGLHLKSRTHTQSVEDVRVPADPTRHCQTRHCSLVIAANQPSRHPILGRSTLGYLGHPLVHGGADRRPSRETVLKTTCKTKSKHITRQHDMRARPVVHAR